MTFPSILHRIFRYVFLLNALCGVALVFAPIVWMKIGPLGKDFYGPTVPDIWIYGGGLTGKDLSFAPLAIIMLTQLTTILIGIICSMMAFFQFNNRASVTVFSIVILVLLTQFPGWIDWYKMIIRGNSDGAPDISVFSAWAWDLTKAFVYYPQLVCVVDAY